MMAYPHKKFSKDRACTNNLRIAIWLGLDNKKSLEKLRGLEACPLVNQCIVFRRFPVIGLSSTFRQVTPPPAFRKSALLAHTYAAFMTALLLPAFKPHLCLSISLLPHMLFAATGRMLTHSRLAIWLIGTDMYRRLENPFIKLLTIPMLKRADCTMVMGENSKKQLVNMGWDIRKVTVGANAYNLDDYTPTQNNEPEWDVIFTGRIDRYHKGLDILLESVKEAAHVVPSLRCAIVGDGADRQWMEKQSKKLGLTNHVFFLGRRKDIQTLLQKSKIFLMTSAWEGLPASLIEAFACGIPAITSNAGDIETIAHHMENSIVVDDQSSQRYAHAIIQLLSDNDLRAKLARGAMETGRILKNESFERSIRAWEEVLNVCSCADAE